MEHKLAMDYTAKEGKVSSLVNRINYSKNSAIWDEFNTNLQKQNIKLMKNKIVIIGGDGFIGSHLTNLYGNTNSNHSRSNEFGE